MPRLGLLLLIVIVSLSSGAATVAGQTPAATPVASAECGTAPADGLLLTSTVANWTDQSGLLVSDGTGQEIRRIDLPAPIYGLATRTPGKALYWLSEGEIVLVDAFAGTAQPLEIPAEAVRNMAPVPAPGWGEQGDGWWVLGGIRQPAAYLVNLATGDAYDVAAAIARTGGELTQTMASFVAPDNQHVLIWTGDGLYLFAAADPDTALPLADGDELAAPGFFRRGGAELISSRPGSGTQIEVLVDDLARGEGEGYILNGGIVDQRRLMLFPLADPNELLLIWMYGPVDSPRSSALEVLDLTSGRTRFLVAPGGSILTPVVTPQGDRVFFGAASGSAITWQFVDLATGAVTPVDDDSPAVSLVTGIGGRWVLLYPIPQPGPGIAGARYTSVDLETGLTTPMMTQRAGFTYTPPLTSRGDGRYALVSVSDDTRGGLVLLDLATGRSRTIAEGATVSGAFSPDGCWVAAARVDAGGASAVDLLPIAGGETITLSDATLPVWVLPEPAG